MDWFQQNAQNVIFLHFLACVPFAVSYSFNLISTFKVLISHLFVQVWGTIIMQKRYKGMDYFLALLVTLGCSIFILFPVMIMPPVSATPFLMLFDI